MTPNSFNVNSAETNSVDAWGIKIINHDVFSPGKRARSQQIPFRHGAYDYGDKYYDNRQLRVECHLTRQLAKADFREIVYALSQRNRLFFWDEPDKYYVSELLDSVDVDVFPRECGRVFTLPFNCDPFAYGAQITLPVTDGLNAVQYRGTAEAPTLLVLRNPNAFTVTGITVTAVQLIK